MHVLNTCSPCQSYILLTAYAFFLVACSSIASIDRVCNYGEFICEYGSTAIWYSMVSHHFSFPYQSHIHIGQGYILAEDGSNYIQFRSFREPFSWCRVSFPNVSFINLDCACGVCFVFLYSYSRRIRPSPNTIRWKAKFKPSNDLVTSLSFLLLQVQSLVHL